MKYSDITTGNVDGFERRLVLDLYGCALSAVRGDLCVARALAKRRPSGRIWAVAIGKAADAMLTGAARVLGRQLERALLITKHGYTAGHKPQNWEIIEAGHPLPDADSLRAGQRLLVWLGSAPADVHWLFLISGGASSVVDVLPEPMTLDDLRCLNAWLLSNGWPIGRMNALRRRTSRIKGGGLLQYLDGRAVSALFISDVPDDNPAVIGSGLLVPPADDEPKFDTGALPDRLRFILESTEHVQQSTAVPPHVEARVVASLDDALSAATECATAKGYAVVRSATRLGGDAVETGRAVAAVLKSGAPGVYLWGGEVTVQLPETPGRGGRCQQLALAAAECLAGRHGVALLAAGTDGSDGPGDVAGACVDGETLRRGMSAGLDARDALRAADAGRFLDAAGDLIDTGPTGTNVTDVVIAVKTA